MAVAIIEILQELAVLLDFTVTPLHQNVTDFLFQAILKTSH